jgi:hypothetical protein
MRHLLAGHEPAALLRGLNGPAVRPLLTTPAAPQPPQSTVAGRGWKNCRPRRRPPGGSVPFPRFADGLQDVLSRSPCADRCDVERGSALRAKSDAELLAVSAPDDHFLSPGFFQHSGQMLSGLCTGIHFHGLHQQWNVQFLCDFPHFPVQDLASVTPSTRPIVQVGSGINTPPLRPSGRSGAPWPSDRPFSLEIDHLARDTSLSHPLDWL